MTIPEQAAQYALEIAADDSHGYSQAIRWPWEGPDFDCSSLVIWAYTCAGVDLYGSGARSTWDMIPIMLSMGFEDVTASVDLRTGRGLKIGDVLMKTGHTALYAGNGLEVEASIAETGDIYGQPGDQTGAEILTQPYRPTWKNVYRLIKGGDKIMLQLDVVGPGSQGDSVKAVQGMLRGRGYKNLNGKTLLKIDGSAGSNTINAIKQFQADHGLEPDGYCGQMTANVLFYQ